jgi:hypothetical protein
MSVTRSAFASSAARSPPRSAPNCGDPAAIAAERHRSSPLVCDDRASFGGAPDPCGPGRRRTRWRRARSTRLLPDDRRRIGLQLLTSRNRGTSRPEASASAKYFWFCCIVRIRHSCGTARNAGSNVPAYTAGASTSPVTSSSRASGMITASPSAARSSCATIFARRPMKLAVTLPSAASVSS